MKILRVAGTVIALVLVFISCKKEVSNEGNQYMIRLKFTPTANGEPLEFGKQYLNPLGEDFSISAFKMYIGHISLVEDGTIKVAENREAYYLLNAAEPASFIVETGLNGRKFTHIGFQIGIDSIYNVSGAQAGVLDPANGMFWTWSTGYIMAKLEGNSSYSNEVNNNIVYHIGGFKSSEQSIRQVVLPLPGQQSWALDTNTETEIEIKIDIDKWFSSVHQLYIAATPAIMTPGAVSMQYADNYASLFNTVSINRY
ncbi:MbnP family protein [Pollutibacter soli]|uniref:MbnP family protein n=1 Tax=Pollutibacter soli TaxID=3034157 RepID=UPI00301414F8